MERIISHELKETEELGKAIAQKIKKRDIICLTGDLGAGKTTLTKYILMNLGVNEYITSPTYTIVNEYHTPIKVFHFDVYRINDLEEMFEIGFDDYLSQDAIIIIEWANLIKDIIPKDAIWIDIKYNYEKGQRIIEICGMEGLYENIEY